MDLKYYGLCLAVGIARYLPMRLGYLVAGCAGDIYFCLSPKRRKNAINNIQRAMDPSTDKKVIHQKARQVFKNAAKNYFDLTKLSRIDLKNLDGKVKIEGMDHLTQAVNKGKGVIIATAHLGNFEFGAHVIASSGINMIVLVEAFNSTPFLRKVRALRQGKGVKVLPVDMIGVKEGYQSLRHGGTLTIVGDRDITGNGIKIKFLGQETSFPVGAVDLALRTGATIVPIFSLRKNSGKTEIYIEPPLKLSNIGDRNQALRENLENLAAIFEKYIRTYPEQWVVLESNHN